MADLVEDVRRALRERAIYQRALRTIANINNGPDRASGEYRAHEAASMAQIARDTVVPVHRK